MSLFDLDPNAWWHAGWSAAVNLFAFVSGIVGVLLVALIVGAALDEARSAYRRHRTSRRAWRQHTG